MKETQYTNGDLLLFCAIVNDGKGSQAMRLLKEHTLTDSVVLLGKGVVSSEILKLLGITETRKEVLFSILPNSLEEILHQEFYKLFHFEKHNRGISFSLPLRYVYHQNIKEYGSISQRKGENTMKYQAIVVVVDKGNADQVLESAEKAGSTGGTLLHGRGTGSKKGLTLFSVDIEPEKDILLILTPASTTEAIAGAIRKELSLEEEGHGILFILDVSQAVGLYKG